MTPPKVREDGVKTVFDRPMALVRLTLALTLSHSTTLTLAQAGAAMESEEGEIEIILSCEKLNHVEEPALILGFIFMGVDMLFSICFMVWTVVNFSTPVVKASQPHFLLMISFGALVSSTTIYSLSIEDRSYGKRADEDGGTDADAYCGIAWWTYSLGFIFIFAPLFTKLWRVNAIFNQKKLTSIQVS